MPTQARMLNKDEVVAYVGANASKFGLDPAAVLAVANQEGLKTIPGTWWQLPGEWGQSFGPPSWYQGGAGGNIVNQQGTVSNAAQWAWTPAGLDYWLQSVAAAGASGLQGAEAVRQIIGGYGWGFERPAAKYAAGEFTNAMGDYPKFQQQIGSGNAIVPVPDPSTTPFTIEPGQTQLPTPTNPQQQTNTQTQATTGTNFHLFDTPVGPINLTLPWNLSGLFMVLAAIFAILVGALLWDKSRGAITTGAMMAA